MSELKAGDVVSVVEGSLAGRRGIVTEVIDPLRAIRVRVWWGKGRGHVYTFYASELA